MTDAQGPILDHAVLAALSDSVGGDDSFVADLVRTYLADGRDQLEAISAAVAARDAAALVRPAHTLKGASFTVGAMRLGETSRALEQRGRSGDLEGSDGIVATASEEFEAASQALQTWLVEHGGGEA